MASPTLRSWVVDKRDARERVVLDAIRKRCQDCGGVAWLSRRMLTEALLFRNATETMAIVNDLVRRRRLCRVSAPGRGQGRGRTLYWLPGTSKKRVLRELRGEAMPHRAVVVALSFFVAPENGLDGDRQEALFLQTGPQLEKGRARATRANGPPAPSVPPRQATDQNAAQSAPPSTRRLSKHGLEWERLRTEQIAAALERIRRHGMIRGKSEPP